MPETTTTTPRARLRTAWRAVASVPVRLLLSLGLVLGFAAVGTTAYWADTATFRTGKIEAGSLDLQLGGRNPQTGVVEWSAVGLDQDWNYSVLQLDNVSPGESVAMELHLRNVGTTPLTYTAVGRSTTDSMSPHLLVTNVRGGTAANTGTRDAVNRTGTCSGGSATWWNNHALSTAPTDVTPGGAAIRLDPGATMHVCMLARFAGTAPNSYQGASTTVEVDVTAKQVGAP